MLQRQFMMILFLLYPTKSKALKLLANDFTGSVTVDLNCVVTFICEKQSVSNESLQLYKDDVYITQTTLPELYYAMTLVNTDLFVMKCSMGTLFETVSVNVRQCSFDFKSNSQPGNLEVTHNSKVQFVCETGPSCTSEITLINEDTGEVLQKSISPGIINYNMDFLICGRSFYVVCRVGGDETTQKRIFVRLDPCPELTLSVNNQIGNDVTFCFDRDVFVSCSYQGTRLPTSIYIYWLGGTEHMTVLNTSLDNIVTYTLSDKFVKDNVKSYIQNLLGCSLEDVSGSSVEVDPVIKLCHENSQTSESKSNKTNLIIGVSLGAVSLLFLTLCTLVVYYKHKTHSSRLRERHRVTNGSPSFSLNSCQILNLPPPSLQLDGGSTWTQRPPSLYMGSGHRSEPPSYDDIFYTDNSLQSGLESHMVPSLEFNPLPPSYEDVVHFYKNNGHGISERTTCKSI